ncbi:sigma D regulator [Shewanella yunxiaonensis]|uniref:Sigma D regulator n=1 Tax=Shewanella yunxiaonensis TaxID=2829809 RepID=A0ABX7YU37_9GAMM|nr:MULTISPECIES: sigma D regulator [Shewanella]MDF0535149.1 sigma D regulator [Shewanella sp. A32]QUN06164.1 sigma D regulator [Shewanella yunxiaonensis]
MLTELELAEQKWGGASRLIDRWLHNRRELLSQYFKLAGIPYGKRDKKSLPEVAQVHLFCEHLVDYISECHFRVINQIMHSFPEGQKLTDQLLPKLLETTELLLDFIDKYADVESDDMLFELDDDLAELVNTLETRLQLEDRLLQVLYTYRVKREEAMQSAV